MTELRVYENETYEDVILPTLTTPDGISAPVISDVPLRNVIVGGDSVFSGMILDIDPGSELAIQGWQFDAVFSATNYRKISWTGGTIRLTDGTTFTIAGDNSGDMTVLTYIYFDKTVSETVLQITTTAANAVGSNKILIAVAKPNTDTASMAQFQVFGGSGGVFITVDQIAANSASVNEFISNTAQIKDAIITNAKITSLGVNKLIAGTITSKAILLAIAGGTGDSYIAGGNAIDLTNWVGGDANGGAVILGLDDSDDDKGKFFAGNYSTKQYALFNGTDFIVNDSKLYNQSFFGDGIDGDVTISANTTLTSDMYYNNLTVNSGYTLNTGGYRVFVKGTLTNNGTIERIGNAGGNGENGGTGGTPQGGSAGVALSTGTIYGSLTGKVGGNGGAGGGSGGNPGSPGVTGDNQTESYASSGSAGGTGASGSGGAGGAGGRAGTAIQTTQPIRNVSFATIMREFSIANTVKYITSSAGSGSGGGGGSDVGGYKSGGAGGGSGSSGGVGVICARVIINNETISCAGGAGGNGGAGGWNSGTSSYYGAGGGGAGGSGGILVLIYNSLTNTGTITAVGGAKGLKGTAGGGSEAQDGTNGLAGRLIQLEV